MARYSSRSSQPKDPNRARPSRPVLPDLENMSSGEAVVYIQLLLDQLKKKQSRELAYLTRRFDHGTNTSTDELYREDQLLEDRLIHLLEHIIKTFGGTVT